MRPYNDDLGQGRFCNALWKDDKGLFCSTAAAEGSSGVHCSFTEKSCHLVTFKTHDERKITRIQCGGTPTGEPTFVGVCQDFEPSAEMRKKFHLED